MANLAGGRSNFDHCTTSFLIPKLSIFCSAMGLSGKTRNVVLLVAKIMLIASGRVYNQRTAKVQDWVN
jgi:hypothetical protein